MTERAIFLGRLRERIQLNDYQPRRPYVDLPGGPPRPRFVGAPAGLDGFTRAWTALGGHLHDVDSVADVPAAVSRAVDGRGPVVAGTGALLTEVDADLRWPECGRAPLADAAVGVIEATAAIAATGSVLVDTTSVGGRSLSLLPPVAVFVLRAADLVDTPSDVLRARNRYWPEGVPSQIVLVSGPSRSADIEMTLTVGVHGPGEVHAVVVASD